MKKTTLNFVLIIIALSFGCKNNATEINDIKHVKVYYEEGRYGGWPANHGMWIWGDEILVGFVEAPYKDRRGHNYDVNKTRDKYARSLDGGNTWTIEDAFANGQTAWRYNNRHEGREYETPKKLDDAINFNHADLALTFLRQTNDTGPSHFYYSYNRGNSWKGPYSLPNLGTEGIATRTDYIINGKQNLTTFFTVAKSNQKEGRVLYAQTTDGALSWKKVAWVGPEDEGFEIMPASVRLSESKIISVVRKETGDGVNKLVSYQTTDNGRSWQPMDDPVAHTGGGGSPAALVKMKDGRLALSYIFRKSEGKGSKVCCKFSSDEGRTWSEEIILRQDGSNGDSGYPRMVQREDGKLVVIYYWNNALQEGGSPYRYIAATIFDPEEIE